MPKYIAADDVIAAYGETRFALLSANDNAQAADPESAARAIAGAEAEIDSYVGHRYAMPLPGIVSTSDPSLNEVPENIRFRAVDMAVYRMAKDHDQLTTERRKRYEDAVCWLRDLKDFQVSLGVDAPPATRNGGVVRVGPARTHGMADTFGLV